MELEELNRLKLKAMQLSREQDIMDSSVELKTALEILVDFIEEKNALHIKELLGSLDDMFDIWVSTCDTHGWDPDHLVQFTNAKKIRAKFSDGNG